MKEAYQSLLTEFNLIPTQSSEESHSQLLAVINHLIVNDFEKLISILYRIDVSENKINLLLKAFPEQQAAAIILSLVIDRTAEKIAAKKAHQAVQSKNCDEEKW